MEALHSFYQTKRFSLVYSVSFCHFTRFLCNFTSSYVSRQKPFQSTVEPRFCGMWNVWSTFHYFYGFWKSRPFLPCSVAVEKTQRFSYSVKKCGFESCSDISFPLIRKYSLMQGFTFFCRLSLQGSDVLKVLIHSQNWKYHGNPKKAHCWVNIDLRPALFNNFQPWESVHNSLTIFDTGSPLAPPVLILVS